jgi:hypothetical protein
MAGVDLTRMARSLLRPSATTASWQQPDGKACGRPTNLQWRCWLGTSMGASIMD